MKGNMSQIYPIPFLSLSKKIILVKIYLPIFFQVLTEFAHCKLDAIVATTTFAPGCKRCVFRLSPASKKSKIEPDTQVTSVPSSAHNTRDRSNSKTTNLSFKKVRAFVKKENLKSADYCVKLL